MLVIDKVCKRLLSIRGVTPPSANEISLDKTSTSVKNIRKSMFNQLANTSILEKFCQT